MNTLALMPFDYGVVSSKIAMKLQAQADRIKLHCGGGMIASPFASIFGIALRHTLMRDSRGNAIGPVGTVLDLLAEEMRP